MYINCNTCSSTQHPNKVEVWRCREVERQRGRSEQSCLFNKSVFSFTFFGWRRKIAKKFRAGERRAVISGGSTARARCQPLPVALARNDDCAGAGERGGRQLGAVVNI